MSMKDNNTPKTNAERVREHQKKLTTIKIRFPNEETCGIDYKSLISERAKELGFVNTKGSGIGTGNINAYILHLIEKDLGTELIKGTSFIDSYEKKYQEVLKQMEVLSEQVLQLQKSKDIENR